MQSGWLNDQHQAERGCDFGWQVTKCALWEFRYCLLPEALYLYFCTTWSCDFVDRTQTSLNSQHSHMILGTFSCQKCQQQNPSNETPVYKYLYNCHICILCNDIMYPQSRDDKACLQIFW